ncbi:FtsX-like permease family protein [Roseicyclus persicicus]|uniref:FtsX-like permease family protein n=1 Tax=Roseicyclus persicicus TaxID=2650661 RepID=A0A7X6JZ67_9RHOB|nr:FtsX-like permease family protein [Roseibacterium persicicum]NKX44845.1 FtsX-like permease family protein [Roseibacterium persicicum]
MQAIDIKLMRDFRRLWVQGLAIAVVLACGVAILLTAFGMHTALTDTRAAYYERNRFAEVFADARRAPDRLLPEIREIPGVYSAEARVQGMAVLDLPGRVAVAMGQMLSWPADDDPLLNVPILRTGLYPARAGEVMVTTSFAEANGFRIGDTFHANLNGQRRELTITGTALSPEFIYTIGPGALMPDNEGFGIIWMPEAELEAAFDMAGAFNHLALRLTADAVEADVLDALDALLDPYGGLGAYGRAQQVSDAFVSAEIDQLRGMAVVVPPIFFAISAFLVGMVMSRIVALDRAEIGLLKALGYTDLEISLHYLLLAALIAVIGVGLGWGLGTLLARAMAWQYARFFEFPYLLFRVPSWVYAMSGLAALATTMLGALRAALMAARLAPAVAMQPPAPPVFRKTILDRVMAAARLKQTTIMVLRSLIRWPVRSALTMLGLGAATAAVISASFMFDALARIIDLAFNQSYRQDAMVLFADDVPDTALSDLMRLPGVMQAEAQQFHAATLRNGPREKRVSIEARPEGATLSRVIGADGTPIDPPPGGILLSDRLAAQLEVGVGDTLEVEFMTGRRETHEMVVAGLVEQYFGLGAYVEIGYLDRLFRRAPTMSVGNILIDEPDLPALHAALQDTPRLSGLILMRENRAAFEDTISENVTVVNTVYAVIAILITVGVAYNGARIQLSERARELASLRILGFTRAEVSRVLVGETMLLALLAQPVGWLMGAWIARALASSFTSDLYAIPLVLEPKSFAWASLVVLAASLGSVMIVRRRIDRMDLVEVMKTRE